MADFPAAFPNPSYQNHSMELRTGAVRMAMQAGNFKQRRLWDRLPVYWNLQWQGKTDVMQSIIRWLNFQGYDWFNLYVVSPLTPGAEAPLRQMSVRVISNIDVVNAGFNFWEISAIVECEPVQTLDAG